MLAGAENLCQSLAVPLLGSKSRNIKSEIVIKQNNIAASDRFKLSLNVVSWAQDTSTSPTDLRHEIKARELRQSTKLLHRLRFSCEEEERKDVVVAFRK